ncbi:MAG: phosphoribosylanthranilate isomerase [Acidobacteria bacterium]|nr:MAG: phosphoribosylanthranilate isomerase [Acidobacteriota bacterium]
MTHVKICGITTAEDALLAAELGASALGFVFWPHSPRYIEPIAARAIVARLPPFITPVGVFVNQPIPTVLAIARFARLGAVQLHGDETAEEYATLPTRVIKALPLRNAQDGGAAGAVPSNAMVLLDAYDPVRRGGTGRAVDWSVASAVARHRPVILSGGLHAGNVVDAIAAVHPYGVDASSGIEVSPGRKDPAKLRALFAALRES